MQYDPAKIGETFWLSPGAHHDPESGLCAMEAVAWLAGEPHSDHPSCVCRIIRNLTIALNDTMDEETRNEQLPRRLFKMIGTASDDAVLARLEIMADFTFRMFDMLRRDSHCVTSRDIYWVEPVKEMWDFGERSCDMQVKILYLHNEFIVRFIGTSKSVEAVYKREALDVLDQMIEAGPHNQVPPPGKVAERVERYKEMVAA